MERVMEAYDYDIYGVVFGVVIASCSSCVMFVTSSDLKEKSDYAISGFYLLITLCILSIVSCVSVIGITLNGRHVVANEHTDNTIGLKLKFLYFFGFGSALNQICECLYDHVCRDLTETHTSTVFVTRIILVLFFLTQTCFMKLTLRQQFTQFVWIYIALGILSITNISIWTHFTVNVSHHNNWLFNSSTNRTCSKNSTSNILYKSSRPIMEPMTIEYVLLCCIFIFELWPKIQNRGVCDLLKPNTSSDSAPSLLQNGDNINRRRLNIRLLSATIGFLIILPIVSFKLLDVFTDYQYAVETLVCYCFSNTLLICLLILCFYLIPFESHRLNKTRSFLFVHYILLFGASGFMFFITLSLFNNIYRTDNVDPLIRILAIYMEIAFIILCFLQTTFILHINNYQRNISEQAEYLSIGNISLTIGVIQLGYWSISSFLSASYGMSASHEREFYGKKMYRILFYIFFPFGVFYHFKSFIFFYDIHQRFKIRNHTLL
ncbi:uncharacterized protein LOC143045268 [Mytilus galloprovincialis]|uniref:uncharacterized protein LOC143045268 n=1 Tax=Mytilus galloprovincialis TaxID=29158 RepID=UPI003F7CB3F5